MMVSNTFRAPSSPTPSRLPISSYIDNTTVDDRCFLYHLLLHCMHRAHPLQSLKGSKRMVIVALPYHHVFGHLLPPSLGVSNINARSSAVSSSILMHKSSAVPSAMGCCRQPCSSFTSKRYLLVKYHHGLSRHLQLALLRLLLLPHCL